MDPREYHKLLFTLSHYTEKILEIPLQKHMSEFDQFVIGFLKNSCNDITPFEVFSKMAKTLEQERNLKKDARDWIERIISLHNKIKN